LQNLESAQTVGQPAIGLVSLQRGKLQVVDLAEGIKAVQPDIFAIGAQPEIRVQRPLARVVVGVEDQKPERGNGQPVGDGKFARVLLVVGKRQTVQRNGRIGRIVQLDPVRRLAWFVRVGQCVVVVGHQFVETEVGLGSGGRRLGRLGAHSEHERHRQTGGNGDRQPQMEQARWKPLDRTIHKHSFHHGRFVRRGQAPGRSVISIGDDGVIPALSDSRSSCR
jgi:hypothetical protein